MLALAARFLTAVLGAEGAESSSALTLGANLTLPDGPGIRHYVNKRSENGETICTLGKDENVLILACLQGAGDI